MTVFPDRSLLERVTGSPINYWGAFIVDMVVAATFGWLGATRYDGSLVLGVVLVGSGVLAWTLVEYFLHRWILHGVLARDHARHHRDTQALIATPLMVIPFCAALIFTLAALASSIGAAAVFTFGWYVGYNYFVIVHHMQHFYPDVLARSALFERNLRLHELHHRHPDTHFGISNSLWDRAFGSRLEG
jgi:predicted transporter